MSLSDDWQALNEHQKLRYFGVISVTGIFFLVSAGFLVSTLFRKWEFEKNPVIIKGYIESLKRHPDRHNGSDMIEYLISYQAEEKVERTIVMSSFSFLRIQDSVRLYYIPARKEVGLISDVSGSYTYYFELMFTIISAIPLSLFLAFPQLITSLDKRADYDY